MHGPDCEQLDSSATEDDGSYNYPSADVTFQVDMNLYGELGASLVYVNGNFNGWCGDCNPMSDEDGDGVWVDLAIGCRND